MTLAEQAIAVIAEYLDECDVEEFVDEEFSKSAAKEIVDLLANVGLIFAAAPPLPHQSARAGHERFD